MERIKHEWIADQAVRIIKAVLEEGISVGKDAGDIPDWQTKSARFHAMRAHAHMEHWLWDQKSEGHMPENQVEDKVHLYHTLLRDLMAILRLEDEEAHSD